MQYKITVEKLTPVQDKNYPNCETIYEQKVDVISLVEIIKAVNRLED